MSSAASPALHSVLRDNYSRGKAGAFLKEHIRHGSKLSFVSAYFTIHAYAALKDELEAADSLRFLFGEPASVTSLDKEKKQARHYTLGADTGSLTLENQLSQKQNARECADWIRRVPALRPRWPPAHRRRVGRRR